MKNEKKIEKLIMIKNEKKYKNEKHKENKKNPPLRRRSAMGEPLTSVRNCGGYGICAVARLVSEPAPRLR